MTPNDHVFLTGGTGFFGLALLRHWQQMGPIAPRLTILSRDPVRFARRHPDLAALAQWVAGDMMQSASMPIGQRFSHVIHAAADSTFGPQLTPMQRYDQIVIGTRNLLDFAVICGAKRFLLTSSGAVYGRLQGATGVREDCLQMPDPMQPGEAYGVAKRAAEHLCALYHQAHGLDTIVARCFTFIGRDLPLDAHFAVGNFIRDALTADAIVVKGDGLSLRSYMHQQDLAHWLTVLLERGRAGDAYNVGAPEAWSVGELAHRVRDLLAPHKPVLVLSQRDPAAATRSGYVPNVDRCLALGLKLRWSLDDAIRESCAMSDTALRSSARPQTDGYSGQCTRLQDRTRPQE